MREVRLHLERLQESALYQEMLESRRRAAEEHERARRRSYVLAIAGFLFWTGLSVGIASWGMGTIAYARFSLTIIETAVLVGYAGVLVTLVFAHQRLAD